jgi:DNA-binding NarL/FixJ family response regulator
MLNLIIADDHDLVRDTIAAYLLQQDDLNVVAVATLDEARTELQGTLPIDLVILDYNMPGMDGLTGMQGVLRDFPHTKVVLMSGIATTEIAQTAMDLGAHGFLPKSATATSMMNALRFILAGERYFPVLFSKDAMAPKPTQSFMGLTARELETLSFLCLGQSNKEIARELGLQEVTVKLHVKNIMSKCGVNNRTQAALLAKENGVF